MRDQPIVMTDSDVRRLRGLVASRADSSHDQDHLKDLETELERALVLDANEVPTNVVTMHSRVFVLDLTSGERHNFALVLPRAANVSANRISVLAPLGTALIGHSEGDEVEWLMPGGLRRLRIERVSREGGAGGAGATERVECGERSSLVVGHVNEIKLPRPARQIDDPDLPHQYSSFAQ